MRQGRQEAAEVRPLRSPAALRLEGEIEAGDSPQERSDERQARAQTRALQRLRPGVIAFELRGVLI